MNREQDKGQTIRLIDVLVLGPFMVWFAWRHRSSPGADLLAVAGIGTVVLNGINFVATERGRG